ncbi:MAG TPA: hypothetical protein EYP71_03180, partial [Dehalococcoidia bacterium]|nr:hypothetical protein [Dehalococcoidia bacterium]
MSQPMTCPYCGSQSVGQRFCTTCGARVSDAGQQQAWARPPAAAVPAEAPPPRKYGLLRIVSSVYRIIGWVVIAGGSLFSVGLVVIAAQGDGVLEDFIPLGSGLGVVGIAAAVAVASILYGLFM